MDRARPPQSRHCFFSIRARFNHLPSDQHELLRCAGRQAKHIDLDWLIAGAEIKPGKSVELAFEEQVSTHISQVTLLYPPRACFLTDRSHLALHHCLAIATCTMTRTLLAIHTGFSGSSGREGQGRQERLVCRSGWQEVCYLQSDRTNIRDGLPGSHVRLHPKGNTLTTRSSLRRTDLLSMLTHRLSRSHVVFLSVSVCMFGEALRFRSWGMHSGLLDCSLIACCF